MLLISLAAVSMALSAAPAQTKDTTSRPAPARDTSAAVTKRAVASPVATRTGGAARAAADVDATIRRAKAAWARVRTLRASFEQTLTNPITGSAMVSRGELQQRKPNRIAITFTDPAGDRIVGDGKYVWVYLQSATPGQVVRLANTDVGAASSDLIGQFLNTPRSRYDATDGGADTVGSRPARIVVLVARPGQALPFVRARVWVDAGDGLIRQFESTDPNGVTRKVRLLTLKPNADVSAAAFVFTVPDGVRVVDR